jgi:Fe-S oxidoreductase
VKGRFFESISSSYIVGAEFYCQAACLHFAKTSVIKERLPRVIEKVNQLGIKELVCMHDECYGSFTSLASAYNIEVSFKPIHYLEFLYERLWELKSEIRPLNIKAAYQRPCSSRLSSDKCHFVEDIFNLIGVELVERQYQGDKALCCGIMLKDIDRFEIANDVQKRNIDDMIKGKAEYCVFSCTACQKTLSEKVSQKGINPIHIIDLCKIAIGEGTKEGE